MKRQRPHFLAWAINSLLSARGDWVFQGSDREATNFLVQHYFNSFPHQKGYR